MGTDFIARKRRAFRKMYDGGVSALDTADLLIVDEVWDDQSVVFDMHPGVTLTVGEELLVQVSGATLVAHREGVVAVASALPPVLLGAITRNHGFAVGRVVLVSDYSGTANIAFRVERG